MSAPSPLIYVNRDVERHEGAIVGLTLSLNTIAINLERLDARLKSIEEKHQFWSKVWLAVVTAVAVALIGFLLKISFMVQGAKLG